MIFPYQPHRFNKRVVLVIHVYIQLQETGLFSLHKGFGIVCFSLRSLHNIRQYKIASCKNIRSLEDNKSVDPVHVFFHHSLNIYLHISYICTADRQAWLIHPQRGLFTEKCREILFFLMYFQLKCCDTWRAEVVVHRVAMMREGHHPHRHALHSDSLP